MATIPEENKAQFWTLARNEGETLRDYVFRCWTEARGEDATGAPAAQIQAEVVREGYGSPYRFGAVLRGLVGDDSAGVYAAHNVRTGGRVYYAWDGDNANGDGPHLCAFYDPTRGPTFGRRPDTIDWHAAIDGPQEAECNGGQSDAPCPAALRKLDHLTGRELSTWTGTLTCPECGARWRGEHRREDGEAFDYRLERPGALVACAGCDDKLAPDEVYEWRGETLCPVCYLEALEDEAEETAEGDLLQS